MAGILCCALSLRAADCTVVFNEVMYHPQTNEPAFEWIELHNQMAVDMDLSGWRLAKAIDFTFAEGTAIAGGGFLVVALAPTNLTAVFGITNVVGPFAGRLGNGGDTIELRNNNDRLMDKVDYGPKGDWPVAPDGAGPSLAKYDEESASDDAANWRASVQMDGSPGRQNFPPGTNSESTVVRFDAIWRYTAGVPTDDWRSVSFAADAWPVGTGVFSCGVAGWAVSEFQPIATIFHTGVGTNGAILPPGQPDPHYELAVSAYSSNPPPPAIAATVMQNHPAWVANDTLSRWIGAVSNGTANLPAGLYRFRTSFDLTGYDTNGLQIVLQMAADNAVTNVALNGVSNGFNYTGHAAFGPVLTLTNGFVDGTNTLEVVTMNAGTSASPAGFRLRASGAAVRTVPTNTVLATSATTYCFRTTFLATGPVATASLRLRALVDDGAVFHLNGTELLRLNLPAVSSIASVAFSGPFLLPGGALVAGTNVLAVELRQAAAGTNDAVFGAELTVVYSNSPLPALPALAFNEMPDVTNQVFWAEIVNHGDRTVALSNYVFKRFGLPDQEYIIPPTNLPPGGFLVIERAQLGWGADPGDALVLYTPGKSNVIDAMVAKRYDRARWPEGSGAWRHPAALTPGATNQFAFQRDVVINEIMYHPRDPQGAATNSPEQWIELFNRGSNVVDLTGWRLDKDGSLLFSFPAGTSIGAGAFLVVALDAAYLHTLHPAIDIIGNFSNRLSGSDALIELFDAANYPADGAGNRADAVDYHDASPWPEYADGLGSSLERRNPWMDPARPEAWAASDDRAQAAWQTITYSGTATVETANSPSQWREFVCGLLDSGEVLLDDVSVREAPTGAARQVIQNGDFENGLAAWRIIGTHQGSEVIVDPDNAANHVLRLVSSGGTEHMHNHAETTLTNNLPVTNGLVYEVSFRAKWVAGCNRLNTRLYFNRLAALTELAAPALSGTPGAPNSCLAALAGPTFSALQHLPIVPSNAQPIAISAVAADFDGIASATLHYAVGGGAWQDVAMVVASNADGSASLRAGVPGQSAGSVVHFYVEAVDGAGTSAFHPRGGTNSRALFAVADGTAISQKLHTVRLLMTPADVAWMHADTNVMSNAERPCTVITDERIALYDAGVHLQGSERGRDNTTRVGFTIRLPAGQPYRGRLGGFTVDRSGGYSGRGGDNDELLVKHIINRAGLLPGMYDDLCQIIAPRPQDTGTGLMILAKYGNEFLDGQYRNGSDGELFKLELIYSPTSTVANDPEAAKLPQPDVVRGTDLKDLGDDAETYRWVLLKENHSARSHYAPMIALAKAFSQTGAVLDAQMAALCDVDEWMRAVALLGLIGSGDIYTYNSPHNQMIYFRPEDGRAMAFPWDLDSAFQQSTTNLFPGTGSPNTTKLINRPGNLHAYYAHLNDLASFTGDSAYNARWASNHAGRVGQNWNGAVTWLAQRAAWVRSQLNLGVPFAITDNGGAGFEVTNSFVTIGGTAPINVRTIHVNGIGYPITWLTATNWSLTIPLTDYENALSLQGSDLRGLPLTNALASITVTNLGVPAPRPVVINEWMADNAGPGGYPDGADSLFQDWIELFNPNSNTVVLGGWYLTDNAAVPTQWMFPTNTAIGPQQFLLVWADNDLLQNAGTNADLHASFKLNASGETIALYDASTVLQSVVVFSQQVQNVSAGAYPDGSTNLYAMTNWTPRAANVIGPLRTPDFSTVAVATGPAVRLGIAAVPGHLYAVEFSDDTTTTNWMPFTTNRAASSFLDITNEAPAVRRVYRATLIQ